MVWPSRLAFSVCACLCLDSYAPHENLPEVATDFHPSVVALGVEICTNLHNKTTVNTKNLEKPIEGKVTSKIVNDKSHTFGFVKIHGQTLSLDVSVKGSAWCPLPPSAQVQLCGHPPFQPWHWQRMFVRLYDCMNMICSATLMFDSVWYSFWWILIQFDIWCLALMYSTYLNAFKEMAKSQWIHPRLLPRRCLSVHIHETYQP